ncbi:MAG: aryl-sulfate sulfotransferase [Chloroflexi bacterium]|nr:aryl-sulfate sulfotransferase [Chloroflexota bacterium]
MMKLIKLLLLLSMLFTLMQSTDVPISAQEGNLKTVGTIRGSTDGYTLFKVGLSDEVYLIDGEGRIVNEWKLGHPARDAVLRDNGNLVVSHDPVNYRGPQASFGPPYAQYSEYTWEGDLVWTWEFALGAQYQAHHGIEVLPNGNVMLISWDFRTRGEAIAMGRDPEDLGDGLWPDVVFEYDPTQDAIVWEWNAWDHTVQDFDPDLPNYGVISENPHKVDINFYEPGLSVEDWMHTNAVDYNPELDQILISVREFNEIWVIDHGITTEEARGPAGDLLYRWGNPRAYKRGTEDDRQISFQHDAQWVPSGYPGAGNIITFSNRHNFASTLRMQAEEGLDGVDYSKVVEFTPPLQPDGTYLIEEDKPFGPEMPAWSFGDDPDDYNFFSQAQSGVQRLANGNTLIIKSADSLILEVTPNREVAWEYKPPFNGVYSVMDSSDALPTMFRARQYSADYPGLAGRDLTPGDTIEAVSNSSLDKAARIVSGQVLQTALTDDRPVHYFVYVRDQTDVVTITLASPDDEGSLELSIVDSDSFRSFVDPETGNTKYVAIPGPNFFTVSADTPVPYELTLTSDGDIYENVDSELIRVNYGDNFTNNVTADAPTDTFVFWALAGDVIELSIERHYAPLEPVVALLDVDQQVLVTDSDEDADGTASITSFELPYNGIYYIQIAYVEDSAGPTSSGEGRYTFDFLRLAE